MKVGLRRRALGLPNFTLPGIGRTLRGPHGAVSACSVSCSKLSCDPTSSVRSELCGKHLDALDDTSCLQRHLATRVRMRAGKPSRLPVGSEAFEVDGLTLAGVSLPAMQRDPPSLIRPEAALVPDCRQPVANFPSADLFFALQPMPAPSQTCFHHLAIGFRIDTLPRLANQTSGLKRLASLLYPIRPETMTMLSGACVVSSLNTAVCTVRCYFGIFHEVKDRLLRCPLALLRFRV